ncbi:MAG: hypothetical protein KAS93_01100 [Gammaproteobacteria bacterium]|nr:hypothetical protein [Gammaproteobacteria bacterium]
MLNYFMKKNTGSASMKLPMKKLAGEFSTLTVEEHELENKLKADRKKIL